LRREREAKLLLLRGLASRLPIVGVLLDGVRGEARDDVEAFARRREVKGAHELRGVLLDEAWARSSAVRTAFCRVRIRVSPGEELR
jgi:hypothetical protein